ncbi:hypothetical protein CDV31_017355, partial [Fusarium ambrosium]
AVMAGTLFPLGDKTPQHISHLARERFLQGSQHDVGEDMVTPHGDRTAQLAARSPQKDSNRHNSPASSDMITAIEPPGFEGPRHNAAVNTQTAMRGIAENSRALLEDKIKTAEAFCHSFDTTAAQFTTGPSAQLAKDLARELTRICMTLVNGQPQQEHLNQAAPRQPRPLSYAEALSRGHTTRAAQERGRPGDPQRQQKTTNVNNGIPSNDIRVFIRLHAQSPACNSESFSIRSHITSLLKLELNAIPQATRTKTGWAIRPADLGVQHKILGAEATIRSALGAEKVEPGQKWHTYVIPNIPRRIQLLGPDAEVVEIDKLIPGEVKAQAGLDPIS